MAKTRSERKRNKGTLPKLPLIVNDKHEIHHVRDRGYGEAPVRIPTILREIEKTDIFRRIKPKRYGEKHIRAVHDGGLVDYMERACKEAPLERSTYPYVFPVRNPARKPRERSVLAGYWCIDTFTPLNRNVWPAARRAVDCALTAADAVLAGAPAAYALIRPPGHHAEFKAFGGFCYFCNAAVAAEYLNPHGRVAILDIDYHHGNGQQDIFYQRSDVLTLSVHGDPSFAYPYFTGFRDEIGRGPGSGFNVNLPLPQHITPQRHYDETKKALNRIARHGTDFLVLALGLDTAKLDPTGTWVNQAADFKKLGELIGEAGYPTVVVQEGGYRIKTLGVNARNFFVGLHAGLASAKARPRPAPAAKTDVIDPARVAWRDDVRETDVKAIGKLVARTDMFTGEEVAIATELVTERISRGRVSGYDFVVAENDAGLLGYACYGPISGTDGRYDLYWLAVDVDARGKGLGDALYERVENTVRERGGKRIYVETSASEPFKATRRFYREQGFRRAGEVADFYSDGDGKAILVKDL